MTSSLIYRQYIVAFRRLEWLARGESLPDGGNHCRDKDVMDLALSMEVFSRVTAVMQSSTRTTMVFGDLFKLNFNRDTVFASEVTQLDTFHEVVGSL